MPSGFLHHFALAAPLFILTFIGYGLGRSGHWPKTTTDALSRFVFVVALPAYLFRLMSDLTRLPAVDARLLVAFFGSCLLVFFLGRLTGRLLFRLDGVSQSVFALGGVFSNNVLLGVPLARTLLGEAALPAVALVLVFNALILWTLVTVSVEWARHGEFSLRGIGRTTREVLANPVVASILSGSLWGLIGLPVPQWVATPLDLIGQAATPLALIALGMSLAEYGFAAAWPLTLAIALLKLVVQPLTVWLLATALGLPSLETRAMVLLGSLATGVNAYLMSKQFKVMEGPVTSAVLLTTALAAVTTPLLLALAA